MPGIGLQCGFAGPVTVLLPDLPSITPPAPPVTPPSPPPLPPSDPLVLSETADGEIVLDNATGIIEIAITAPAVHAGSYTVDTADLAGGPVNLRAPVIAGDGSPGAGDDVTVVTPGLWLYRGAASGPVYRYQVDKNGEGAFADIAGATSETITLTLDEAGGALRVTETLADDHGSRSVASAPLAVAATAADIPVALVDQAVHNASSGRDYTIAGMALGPEGAGRHVIIEISGFAQAGIVAPVVTLGGVQAALMTDGAADAFVAHNVGPVDQFSAVYAAPLPVGARGDLRVQSNVDLSGGRFAVRLTAWDGAISVDDVAVDKDQSTGPLVVSVSPLAGGAVLSHSQINTQNDVAQTLTGGTSSGLAQDFDTGEWQVGTLDTGETGGAPRTITYSYSGASRSTAIAVAIS